MGRYRNIVVLTGAGISAESGIQTFRAADGLWHEHRIEDVASPEGFARDPAMVQDFYNRRRRQLLHDGVRPNAAHTALARLEAAFGGGFLLVTQNIDDLHERAGSRRLIHMHGELLKMRCEATGRVYPISRDIRAEDRCDCCSTRGSLRPHVVWFGEMPLRMDEICAALAACDLFVAVGTSGNVYPAAGFVAMAGEAGAHTLELNLQPSEVHNAFTEQRYGPASEVVPAFVDELLG